jgi:hypothetical protein
MIIVSVRRLSLGLALAASVSASANRFEGPVDAPTENPIVSPARWFGEGSANFVVNGVPQSARFALDFNVSDVNADDAVVSGRIQYGNWFSAVSNGLWNATSKALRFETPSPWFGQTGSQILYVGHIAGRVVFNAESYLLTPTDTETAAADATTQALKLELGLPEEPVYLIRPIGGATAFAR